MTRKIVAEFKCKQCGKKAETVQFLPKGETGNYCTGDALRYNFGSETMMLSPEEAAGVEPALVAADAGALHAAHPRWLASYCPRCRACYCRQHWVIEDCPDLDSDFYSMHFNTYGTCPAKHRRLMAKDGLGWPEEEISGGRAGAETLILSPGEANRSGHAGGRGTRERKTGGKHEG